MVIVREVDMSLAEKIYIPLRKPLGLSIVFDYESVEMLDDHSTHHPSYVQSCRQRPTCLFKLFFQFNVRRKRSTKPANMEISGEVFVASLTWKG